MGVAADHIINTSDKEVFKQHAFELDLIVRLFSPFCGRATLTLLSFSASR
jgi:hypothetical protein